MESLWMRIPMKYLHNQVDYTYQDERGCFAILNEGYVAGDGREVIREDTVEGLIRVLATVWKKYEPEEQPDFIAGKPNYDKYSGVEPERVLAWLNID